jgi:hypothetical protein
MQLPTMKVVYRSNGAEVVINVSDFDPEKHDEFIEAGQLVAAEEPADEPQTEEDTDEDLTPGGISTVNASAAFAVIDAVDSLEELDALEADEVANKRAPGGRKGVLKAIADRREALSA